MNKNKLRSQSRRLHDSLSWLIRGFTLADPRKAYPNFYLSPQQSYVMYVIKESREISPGEVAKKLRLEKSHLTKIVNSLIEMGAVDKATDEKDRRRLLLTLTPKGEKIFKELDRVSIESFMALVEYVPDKERERVIESVELLYDAMKRLRSDVEAGK